jgi:hypothetical protein
MIIEYLNHFHKYVRPTGVYRLLLLNNYNNHAIFRFKILANNYKIILLYLPAHTTHRLQPLNIDIFSLQSDFYSNEIV